MNNKRYLLIPACAAMLLTSCAGKTKTDTKFDLESVPAFELISADLHDGVWDSIITKTDNGSNLSPQLEWQPAEGAECYAIYMIDSSANNWMHWKSNGVTETTLPQGWAPAGEYVGPYPPSGTHDYTVYVFALEKSVGSIGGEFDAANKDFNEIVEQLDADGKIVACGKLTGSYTHGD